VANQLAPTTEQQTTAHEAKGLEWDRVKIANDFTIGSRVLVAEERGVYVVAGTNKDGSLTCYPGGGQGGGARSFRAEWCVSSERLAKNGKPVRVRTVPAGARRARALWREQHGFPSFDRVKRGVNIPLSSAKPEPR
jgi:hypothetical protein